MLLPDLMKLARPLLLSTMEDIVSQRAPDGGAWLIESLRGASDPGAFAHAFAESSRRTGRAALALTPEETARLRGLGVTWSLARWAVDDLTRAALLLRAGEALPPEGLTAVADRAYHAGDAREQQAVLRTLPLLPQSERFPALNFNHMVLTALVTGVALDRMVGLGARVTPELVRMANDDAVERRTAGRSVPADLDYITDAARVVAA